jgi:hypothetical protein
MRLPRVRFTIWRMLIGVALLAVLMACFQGVVRQRLTVVQAREALLALLRSGRVEDLRQLDQQGLSRQAERPAGPGGTWYWGPFLINLPERSYSYQITYGRRCALISVGRFEARYGRWIAHPPGS